MGRKHGGLLSMPPVESPGHGSRGNKA